jgi:hypothetical protein
MKHPDHKTIHRARFINKCFSKLLQNRLQSFNFVINSGLSNAIEFLAEMAYIFIYSHRNPTSNLNFKQN